MPSPYDAPRPTAPYPCPLRTRAPTREPDRARHLLATGRRHPATGGHGGRDGRPRPPHHPPPAQQAPTQRAPTARALAERRLATARDRRLQRIRILRTTPHHLDAGRRQPARRRPPRRRRPRPPALARPPGPAARRRGPRPHHRTPPGRRTGAADGSGRGPPARPDRTVHHPGRTTPTRHRPAHPRRRAPLTPATRASCTATADPPPECVDGRDRRLSRGAAVRRAPGRWTATGTRSRRAARAVRPPAGTAPPSRRSGSRHPPDG